MTQKIAIWAPSHNFVGLYLHNWGMYRQSEKKLVKQQYLPHMSPQYGELLPTSDWDRFGSLEHPSYFQRLPRLGSVTARHVVVGISQTLRRWTEGATYVWQSDHHVGHWPTFLVKFSFIDHYSFIHSFSHSTCLLIILSMFIFVPVFQWPLRPIETNYTVSVPTKIAS